MYKSYCGLLNIKHIDKKVKLCGWVSNIKILKNIIFINLRDKTGIIQCFVKKSEKKIWKLSISLTIESCIKIYGKIFKKKNSKLNLVEININKLIIYNYSFSLPININVNNSEKIRLKYRYLDLRTPKMFNFLKMRSKIKYLIHNFLYKRDFLDVETPFLSKSFPEGAHDYVVPSRIYKGMYYSLPQSPQIFKQLLMVSGLDKYYQIVKCFRDEDLRSDRQPEFTQIDIELSFSSFKDIRYLVENILIKLFLVFKNINLSKCFNIMNYQYSIDHYGTDKPDLRNPVKFNVKISNFLKKYFKYYSNILSIILSYNNNDIDNIYNKIFSYFKLYYVCDVILIKLIDFKKDKYIYKLYGNNLFLCDNLIQKFILKYNLCCNNLIFLFFFKNKLLINDFTKIRNFVCNLFSLFKENCFLPVWIVNYPMFYFDKLNNIKTFHHPFTMPLNFNSVNNYVNILSNAYDLVINGYELGSGSVRIHNYKMQCKVFRILGISCTYNSKYSFFLESLKYGAPPHLGIALGLDRLVMLLNDITNIKDVIAFPKTTSGLCLLTNSPD